MAERIGEILVARGALTAAQVEAAVDAQVFNGGRLGTNLVDLYELDLDVLTEALAEQRQIRPALQKHFDLIDIDLSRRLLAEDAAQYNMVPLCVGGEPKALAVACVDPLPQEALLLLERIYELPVAQGIAPELRVLYYLERVFGFERANRYRRPRPRRVSTPPDKGAERRKYASEIKDKQPRPQRNTALGKVPLRKVAIKLMGEADPGLEVDSVEKAIRAMRRVNDREKIGQIVVSCLHRAFGDDLNAGLIFILREHLAICWQGFARHPEVNLEGLGIPVDEPGVLGQSLGQHEPLFGTPADGGTDLDQMFWEHLRCGVPEEVAILPIELHDRVGCLIYAQASRPLSDNVRQGISELGSGVNAAFLRLVRAAER